MTSSHKLSGRCSSGSLILVVLVGLAVVSERRTTNALSLQCDEFVNAINVEKVIGDTENKTSIFVYVPHFLAQNSLRTENSLCSSVWRGSGQPDCRIKCVQGGDV